MWGLEAIPEIGCVRRGWIPGNGSPSSLLFQRRENPLILPPAPWSDLKLGEWVCNPSGLGPKGWGFLWGTCLLVLRESRTLLSQEPAQMSEEGQPSGSRDAALATQGEEDLQEVSAGVGSAWGHSSRCPFQV